MEEKEVIEILAKFLKEHCETENAMTFLENAILLAEKVSDEAVKIIHDELKEKQVAETEKEGKEHETKS